MNATQRRTATDEYEDLYHAVQEATYNEDHTYNLKVRYEGEQLTTIWNTLIRLMDKEGITFRFVDGFPSPNHHATGVTRTEGNRYGTNTTILISRLFQGRPYPRVPMIYTMLHELGHYFTPKEWMKSESTRDACEVIAETAAYIVATRLGFNGIVRSADYVKNWTYPNKDPRSIKEESLLVAERLWEAFQRAVDAS